MASKKDLIRSWSPILAQAWMDDEFKKKLISNPKKVLEENGFPINPSAKYTILVDTENVNNIVINSSGIHFQYQDLKETGRWKGLIEELKSNPRIKKEFLAHPVETMRKYGISAPQGKRYHVAFETEEDQYIVLTKSPKEPLSETELERVATGIDLSGGFCTDCSCG